MLNASFARNDFLDGIWSMSEFPLFATDAIPNCGKKVISPDSFTADNIEFRLPTINIGKAANKSIEVILQNLADHGSTEPLKDPPKPLAEGSMAVEPLYEDILESKPELKGNKPAPPPKVDKDPLKTLQRAIKFNTCGSLYHPFVQYNYKAIQSNTLRTYFFQLIGFISQSSINANSSFIRLPQFFILRSTETELIFTNTLLTTEQICADFSHVMDGIIETKTTTHNKKTIKGSFFNTSNDLVLERSDWFAGALRKLLSYPFLPVKAIDNILDRLHGILSFMLCCNIEIPVVLALAGDIYMRNQMVINTTNSLINIFNYRRYNTTVKHYKEFEPRKEQKFSLTLSNDEKNRLNRTILEIPMIREKGQWKRDRDHRYAIDKTEETKIQDFLDNPEITKRLFGNRSRSNSVNRNKSFQFKQEGNPKKNGKKPNRRNQEKNKKDQKDPKINNSIVH